ncbi:hypothetical protein [Novosphingobium taihuense]|uniref:Uncharacterized protein n=1 Tax=Novosphingobium taihuense TaxID=260085 RepID=A0A7W7A9U0_9SPHN|nr:hypothetical protein [Novosphingobium taihuense]MBB4613078.1 hypothetical protein [Novosphingobium taihuense]TWH85221.1 hypothetical protein IQ25_01976 [Novosphingobium taihuense]
MILRKLLSVAAFLVLPTAGFAEEGQDAFIKDMVRLVGKAHPTGEVKTSGDDWQEIRIDFPGEDDDRIVNIGRIWTYCQAVAKSDCKDAKEEFARKSALRPPEGKLSDLRVTVRDQVYYDYVRGPSSQGYRPAAKAMDAYARQIGDDLYEFLVLDSPETIALAGPEALKKLSISEDEAWRIAERQTAEKLPPLPTVEQLRENAVAFEEYEYLGSLLVQRDGFAELARELGPDLFVTAVSDGFVFVGLMPDGEGLQRFSKTVADDCAAQQRCISPNIYRFRDGQWRIATGTN